MLFKQSSLIKKSSWMVLLIMIMALFSPLSVLAQNEEITSPAVGVLVVAHGSSDDSWNQPVRDAIDDVDIPYPVELGFLESVPGEDIPAAVASLEDQGVEHIIAVPIFVASASGHIEEIKYMLGIDNSISQEEADEEGLEVVDFNGEIEMTGALDDHLLVAEILNDRIATVSQQADQEIVVLAAHGTSAASDLAVWERNLDSLGEQLQELNGFLDVVYGFAAVGTPKLRNVVEEQQAAHPESAIIVMPVMLSEGTFTSTKIPSVLEGLTYIYPAEGQRSLLPHDNIAHLIAARVNDAVLGPLQVLENGDLKSIYYSDVAVEEGGKICVCGSFAFRAMKTAISTLWPGQAPDQEDILAEGPYSDGIEHALQTIAGQGRYSLEQREQTPDFYDFRVTNTERGETVKLTVNRDVYPENFFELKAKVKAGTANAEERKSFQSKRAVLVEKVRWNSDASLFSLEIVEGNEESPAIGILVVAHGSSDDSWNQPVRDAIDDVDIPYPVELGFLESVPGEDIPAAVASLEDQGVEHIIAVPIFVASASGHIEEIKYMLGIDNSISQEEADEEGLEVVDFNGEIEMTGALDDHLLVAEILNDRIATVSQQADQEIVVLAAHGTSAASDLAVWERNLDSLGEQLQELNGFLDVVYGFAAVGTPKLRNVVEEQQAAHPESAIIVMPVMLSEGTFTSTKIPSVLEGLTYIYPAEGQRSLLPHDNIAHLIAARVNDAVLGPLQVLENGDLKSIYYSDVAVEEGGKICVCGSFAFRAMKTAISTLWPGQAPDQEDILAEGPYSDGIEHALQTIAGQGRYSLEQREQTPDFYDFRVTNTERGETVKLTVNRDVYPENFFELKAKVKAGTANAEERKSFQSKRAVLVEKVRWNSDASLFSLEIVEGNEEPGTNADLSGLTISSGTLVPSFDPAVLEYSVQLANSVRSIVITPTANHPGSSIKINGSETDSGATSSPIALKVGTNRIDIVVTAEDTIAARNYTISVTRKGSAGDAGGSSTVSASDPVIADVEVPAAVAPEASNQPLRIELTLGSLTAYVNKQAKIMDTAPYLTNNRTMVPLRFVAEAMGAEVKWDGEKQMVTVLRADKEISLVIGESKPGLETPPVIVNGRTMVPVRYISEALGAKVTWHAETRKIEIEYMESTDD